jgi:hypothetical protein
MDFSFLILYFYNPPPSTLPPTILLPTPHLSSSRYITPSTRCTKTHHITTPNITPHRLKKFKSPNFNHYPFLTSIYIIHIILTEIIIILNCCGMTATQLITFVHLCSCNNNITLKMAAIAAETCR